VVCGHLRFDPTDRRPIVAPPNEEGLARVDPNEARAGDRAGPVIVAGRRVKDVSSIHDAARVHG